MQNEAKRPYTRRYKTPSKKKVKVMCKLRGYRLAARLSQNALAVKVGVTGASIANYEKGVTRPVVVEIEKRIAAALGVPREVIWPVA